MYAFWWFLLFSTISPDDGFPAIKSTNDSLYKLAIIVKRSKIFLSIELRMFLSIFFEKKDSIFIAFVFRQKLINFFKLLILSIGLWSTSSPLWQSHIERTDEITDPSILSLELTHCFLIMLPYFWSYLLAYFNIDSFYRISSVVLCP